MNVWLAAGNCVDSDSCPKRSSFYSFFFVLISSFLPEYSSPADSGSNNEDSTSTSTPFSPIIALAGIFSPERHLATALCFDSPLTRNIIRRERLSRAALSDTRWGGRFGELNIARVSGESGPTPHSLPGNKLAVWPSSPSPSKVKSKMSTARSICA